MKKKFSITLIFFLVGIILATAISTSAFKEAYRNRKIQREVEELKAQAQMIQSENESLRQRIAYFQTAEFQEKVAKEKLNMQKPDENVVIVKQNIESEKDVSREQTPNEEYENESPNYKKWWDYFFKYE